MRKIFLFLLVFTSIKAFGMAKALKKGHGRINAAHEFIAAAQLGNVARIRELIDTQGVDINYKDSNGWTALMFAAEKGFEECIQILLARGADPNLKDSRDLTALMIAALNDHYGSVRALEKGGAVFEVPDSDRKMGILGIIQARSRLYSSLCIKNYPLAELVTILTHEDVQYARKTVEVVFERRLGEALIYAARSGNEQCVRILLSERNFLIEDFGTDALMGARANNHYKCMDLLLASGAHLLKGVKYESDGSIDTPLTLAVKAQDEETMDTLIKMGAPIDAPDAFGITPLMHAVKNMDLACAQKLLDYGASPNRTDTANVYPATQLTQAFKNEQLEMVDKLLSKNASLYEFCSAGEIIHGETIPLETNALKKKIEVMFGALRNWMPSSDDIKQARERIKTFLKCLKRIDSSGRINKTNQYVIPEIYFGKDEQLKKDALYVFCGALQDGRFDPDPVNGNADALLSKANFELVPYILSHIKKFYEWHNIGSQELSSLLSKCEKSLKKDLQLMVTESQEKLRSYRQKKRIWNAFAHIRAAFNYVHALAQEIVETG